MTTDPKPKSPIPVAKWIELGAWNSMDALANAKQPPAPLPPPPQENTLK